MIVCYVGCIKHALPIYYGQKCLKNFLILHHLTSQGGPFDQVPPLKLKDV